MNLEKCLVIGNIRDGEYEGLIANNIEPLLLADQKFTSKIFSGSQVKMIGTLNLANAEHQTLINYIENLYSDHKFSSILNFRESYVALTNKICNSISTFHQFHQNTQNTLNKQLQRKIYNQSSNSDLHVKSHSVPLNNITTHAFTNIGYPFILKPENLYSSLFVKIINDNDDLHDYLRRDLINLNNYQRTQGKEFGAILVEEFLEGSNHSIDCAIDLNGKVTVFPIVDVITGRDIGFNDFHHFARYSPSIIKKEMQARCYDLARDAVKSLGLKGTFAHVEFILTPTGPKVLEIGARPGGNRIHVLRNAWGLHLDAEYHSALSGMQISKATKPPTPFGIVTPFPKAKIKFDKIHKMTEISSIPGFMRSYVFVEKGDLIGPASEGFQNAVYFEFSHATVDELRKSLLSAATIDVYESH